mgnify:CR=1 FL=1
MRTAILTMLIILIAVTCYLGVAHWRDGHWGYVLLSIAFVLIFGAAIPDLLKKEKRGKQPTAEQLRDSDEQLYQDAQDQFFETKLHERVKFGAAACAETATITVLMQDGQQRAQCLAAPRGSLLPERRR